MPKKVRTSPVRLTSTLGAGQVQCIGGPVSNECWTHDLGTLERHDCVDDRSIVRDQRA
jgi:hypothetical protein